MRLSADVWWDQYNAYLQTPAWRRFRARVIARDKMCRLCGGTSNLEVHHIPPYGDYRNAPLIRLTTLCRDCHEYVTKEQRARRERAEALWAELERVSGGRAQLEDEARIASDGWWPDDPWPNGWRSIEDQIAVIRKHDVKAREHIIWEIATTEPYDHAVAVAHLHALAPKVGNAVPYLKGLLTVARRNYLSDVNRG